MENNIKALSIAFLAALFLNSLLERGVAYGDGVCVVGHYKTVRPSNISGNPEDPIKEIIGFI